MLSSDARVVDRCPQALRERLWRVLDIHFDPESGTPWWLERAAALGVDPLRDVRTIDDLRLLGDMTPQDLRERPLLEYVPRRYHRRLDRFVLGQSGGTSGPGTWCAYRDDEFHEAFVVPFVVAAAHVGFPAREPWLFVGPSGPHIIGKAVAHLARALGSPDPFSVDFDPRWARRLPEGSFARRRYLAHVIEQALDVIGGQDVGVLFTTPPVLGALAEAMSAAQRRRIRGVHYGGMALDPQELCRFQSEVFPEAVHLAGYGNTLFGCCLELSVEAGRSLDYFPLGQRLILEVVDDEGRVVGPGRRGRVRFTRLDESFLIVRMLERDEAEPLPPPLNGPEDFTLAGLRDPAPPAAVAPVLASGLY